GDFAFAIEAATPDGEATLTLLRAGQEQTLTLALTAEESTGLRTREAPRLLAPATVAAYTLTELGVTLDARGTITNLTDTSPALLAGIAKGDRILAINGTPQDLATYQLTAPALLLLEASGGQTRHIRLDPWHAPDGVRPVGGANVLDPDVVVF
ncbi:MAG: PDZ domain-containing protein, partial [Paracoccaceae bacterium]